MAIDMQNKHVALKYKRNNKVIETPFNPAEEMDLFWVCLADKCPRNCCGEKFDNGDVVNVYNMQHDQVPLLLNEKNQIIGHKGPNFVKMEKDGMYYLDIPKNKGACPFLECGKCGIQDIKPSLCRAYPMVQLDCHVGPIFAENCPGFEAGRERGIRMKKCDYIVMLQNFIALQQYRLDRIRLELTQITDDTIESMPKKYVQRSLLG